MKKYTNNSTTRLALIAVLSVLLLFVQSFKLHMHVQQKEVPSTTEATSTIIIHEVSYLHDTNIQDHELENLNPAEINIFPDSVVKKINLLNPLLGLLFLAILFWRLAPLRAIIRKPDFKTEHPPLELLTHQPLRAPPVHV